jgi:hypothetical protein
VKRRARIALVVLGAAIFVAIAARALIRPFPPDTVPAGAYMRIALAMSKQSERDMFAYLETDAQWSCFSIRDMRKEAAALARQHYPKAEGEALALSMQEEAAAADGPDVFVLMAKRKGFGARLRHDLSGVASVEIDGDRASVVTARGTRYPFRRRENGIWGLTIFTAELMAERERAARDLAVVRAAAADYARAAGQPTSIGSPAPSQPASTTRPN